MHRCNAAARASRTFKNHFVIILCSTDPSFFPMHFWVGLLPQAIITLNLLRSSHLNPRLVSAYEHLEGTFDFNRTPLAPPGTKVVIHEKPKQRASWVVHGLDGWYFGPALDHYRCYKVYVTKTVATRITDTVECFPAQCPMPKTSSANAALSATRDIIQPRLGTSGTSRPVRPTRNPTNPSLAPAGRHLL
jgi:hypothetical protein